MTKQKSRFAAVLGNVVYEKTASIGVVYVSDAFLMGENFYLFLGCLYDIHRRQTHSKKQFHLSNRVQVSSRHSGRVFSMTFAMSCH